MNLTETSEGRELLRRVEQQAEQMGRNEIRARGNYMLGRSGLPPARLTLPVFEVKLVLPTMPEEVAK